MNLYSITKRYWENIREMMLEYKAKKKKEKDYAFE